MALWRVNTHGYQEMLWTGSNVSISSGRRTCEWALNSPRTLLPRLLLRATHGLLLSISIMHQSNPTVPSIPSPSPGHCRALHLVLPDALNGELGRRLIRFSLLWDVIMMAQTIPSVPIPPQSICQVLKSPLTPNIWARANEIGKLNKDNIFVQHCVVLN